MKMRYTALLLTCLTLLLGCNGKSGENEPTPEPATATSIVLAIQNSDGEAQSSFDKNETIQLVATVFDQYSAPMTNQRVNFTADLGALSPDSKLTDASGQAMVTITNETLAIGAGTATATLLELTGLGHYEYINNDVADVPASISTELLLNGAPVNQFKADQQVQIRTQLTDEDNQPLINQIISYTADIGTLSAATALTDSSGIATVTLSGSDDIGAGVVTAVYNESESSTPTNRINYQVIPADAVVVDSEVRLGYFNESDEFVEGEIQLSVANNSISAGGTLGLSVDLVDSENKRVNAPTPVAFTSNCVQNGNASIDENVFSIKGNAKATFEDINCAGTAGTEDVLIASITVNGITNTASANIEITGEQLGSIEFISAEPTSIVLKGTGGQGKQETSTLTFLVKSELGNVLAQQEVEFSLDTSVGGITLSRGSGLTNSQGLVTTQVSAGSVPTAVRVTAKASMTFNGEQIYVQTQSDLLSINTGLPEQRSLTLSASVLNPEADGYNGETSTITAQLADNFNNPVPDGTTVNFTTEGGVIEPSCSTVNGACSVTWTSAEPRVDDHRITILATALGHETFFDTNGNNTFDDADGSAITDAMVSSGFGRHNAEPSGFVDMSEAWRDDNENIAYDAGEVFLDYDNSQSFSGPDALFNGPQCQGSTCAAADMQAIHVRKALILIMSGSFALYELADSSDSTVYESNIGNGTSNPIPDIADGGSNTFTFSFSDTALQALPLGTTISVSSSAGELQGTTSFTMANTNATAHAFQFALVNPLDGAPETALLSISISTPKGHVTGVPLKSINLL
mgnify:CR=1 FL=1